MKRTLLLTTCLLLLSGCDETHSKQWYKEHVDKMKERYSECKKGGDDSQDCKNVLEAHFEWKQMNAKTPDLNNI